MLLIFGIIVFFSLIEAICGFYSKSNRTKDDLMVESFNAFVLMVITKPAIMLITIGILKLIIPGKENILSNWSFGILLIVFLFVDDLLQYWYHRLAHQYKWLWKLHRPHHAAEEMGFLVSYREAIWYYVLMPNIWWLGIFTFLGGGMALAVGIVLKQFVIISSHSLVTWDRFFYKRPVLTPIIKFIERIFITPAFHHAHHAKSKIDGIGNPNGNYGNMFSIWDQVFGSGSFTHKFPATYGLQVNPKESWIEHSLWPFVHAKNPISELSSEYSFEKTTINKPSGIALKSGEYLYCQCGFSKTQPFCDGSHHGTKFQPMKFTIKKDGKYKICQCKHTQSAPFCDNSHEKFS